MSDGIFKVVTCDRCGHEVKVSKEDDDYLIRLPMGWGSASTSRSNHYDLCPICYAKYQHLTTMFMKGDNNEAD